MTLSLLLTTGVGNSFFRRTGDGMFPSSLIRCRLLPTLLTHFWPFVCTRTWFERHLQLNLPLLVPQVHNNPR